jgi:hypothetical protein
MDRDVEYVAENSYVHCCNRKSLYQEYMEVARFYSDLWGFSTEGVDTISTHTIRDDVIFPSTGFGLMPPGHHTGS